MLSLKEELAEIDSKKSDSYHDFSNVLLLSVWTGIGLGAAWVIKMMLAWICPWMPLGAKIVGGLIAIPIVIWLAWNWFCIWLIFAWELSQPIRFWLRDSFQSLDGCGSKIGTRLIQVLSAMFIFPAFGCVLVFAHTSNVWVLLPVPIGVFGLAWLSFGGANWIQETFVKLDDDSEPYENTFLEIGAYEGNGGSGVVAAEQAHITDPFEKQRVLEALQSRRARFVKQIAFWESMQNKKYRDIQIIGLTEMGQAYGMQMSMESVDVELILEVLRATAAEYDRQIAILKEGI